MKLVTLVTILLTLFSTPLHAGPPPWSEQPYSRFSDDEALTEVLRSFASSQGIPIVISEQVDGRVNGNFSEIPPAQYFDILIRAFNLIWYFDGHVLYVYRSDEVASRIVKLQALSVDELHSTLTELGILDGRAYWRALEDRRIVYLSGPERFVSLVMEAVAVLDADAIAELAAQPELIYKWLNEDGITTFASEAPEEVPVLEIIPIADSLRNQAAIAPRDRGTAPPSSRRYLWRDQDGLTYLSDVPPPPGGRVLEVIDAIMDAEPASEGTEEAAEKPLPLESFENFELIPDEALFQPLSSIPSNALNPAAIHRELQASQAMLARLEIYEQRGWSVGVDAHQGEADHFSNWFQARGLRLSPYSRGVRQVGGPEAYQINRQIILEHMQALAAQLPDHDPQRLAFTLRHGGALQQQLGALGTLIRRHYLPRSWQHLLEPVQGLIWTLGEQLLQRATSSNNPDDLGTVWPDQRTLTQYPYA